ncbi:MAG: TldD/PmbA family protein [Rubellimicrobium sp.]|nr:TldD/PmbA family protein [Rubellimicrobium sp.]
MTDRARLTERMLETARRAGADAADAMAVSGTSLSIDVRQGHLEQAERSEGTEIGLRVFVGRQVSVVSSSDTTEATIAEIAARAVAMARAAPADESAGLADPAELAHDLDTGRLFLADPAPEPEPARLAEAALEAEAAAMAVAGVTQVQSAGAGYGARQVHLAATNGFSAGYRRTDSAISCSAIAGAGTRMVRDHDHDSRIFAADLESPASIGRTAGERAAEREGARRPPTGRFPVLFDERIASGLIGHLLAAINGTAIARGASFLRGHLGRQILPPGLSLHEDPHRPRVAGSRLFDAEGLPTRPRDLVRDGVLTGWVLDLGTARRLGLQSTGNAARGPGSQPSPTSGNVTLTPGQATRADLIRDMGTGLLVTGMIGATINPNTGDYSRGATGFWIEGGQIAWPVHEATVAGNLLEMFARMVPANDARPHLSRVVPSILIDGLTIAGASAGADGGA